MLKNNKTFIELYTTFMLILFPLVMLFQYRWIFRFNIEYTSFSHFMTVNGSVVRILLFSIIYLLIIFLAKVFKFHFYLTGLFIAFVYFETLSFKTQAIYYLFICIIGLVSLLLLKYLISILIHFIVIPCINYFKTLTLADLSKNSAFHAFVFLLVVLIVALIIFLAIKSTYSELLQSMY